MNIHINLGSNLGDRMALIGRAVALLSARFAPCRILLDDYIETEPWGYDSQNNFLNRGILVITSLPLEPLAVLDITQGVEHLVGSGAPHRHPDGSYRDRPIDIDIIDIDGLCVDSPRLTLPHPRAALRPFVAEPMARLAARAAQ